MKKVWSAKMIIDLNKIEKNLQEIRKKVGDKVEVMPIIKDNAYGTYLNEKIAWLYKNNIKIVGVAIIDEGIHLRELGYKGEIFILNQPLVEEIENIETYDLTLGIGSIKFLSNLGEMNHNIRIHMEIESGMGRTGISPSKVEKYIEEARKYANIQIEGIYTHFSCGDCDEEYTRKQIVLFNQALKIAESKLPKLKYIHCSNSAGIINFPEAKFNLVRPGLMLYGYYPSKELREKIELKPSIVVKSKISFIKEVEKGSSISYGRSFTTEVKTTIATIPLGYADGIRRTLSNTGRVIIKGKLVPIIGKVCMDCFMADVSNIQGVKAGDEVYLWDNKTIMVEDIAKQYDTINYEVITGISSRVVREYIETSS